MTESQYQTIARYIAAGYTEKQAVAKIKKDAAVREKMAQELALKMQKRMAAKKSNTEHTLHFAKGTTLTETEAADLAAVAKHCRYTGKINVKRAQRDSKYSSRRDINLSGAYIDAQGDKIRFEAILSVAMQSI